MRPDGRGLCCRVSRIGEKETCVGCLVRLGLLSGAVSMVTSGRRVLFSLVLLWVIISGCSRLRGDCWLSLVSLLRGLLSR